MLQPTLCPMPFLHAPSSLSALIMMAADGQATSPRVWMVVMSTIPAQALEPPVTGVVAAQQLQGNKPWKLIRYLTQCVVICWSSKGQ